MTGAEILLIEDEATSRVILETVLTGAGYCVDIAATVSAAHSRLQATRYALVIADWLLPDGDGIFLADRAAAQGSQTLVVTGHLSDLPAGTASRHDILMKPTKPEALLAVVRANRRAGKPALVSLRRTPATEFVRVKGKTVSVRLVRP